MIEALRLLRADYAATWRGEPALMSCLHAALGLAVVALIYA